MSVEREKPKKTSYVAKPSAPPSTLSRFDVVIRVQSGALTETEGARLLGLSRVRFQTLMNRSLQATLGELEQKPPGRPKKDAGQSALEEKVRQLEVQNTTLTKKQEVSARVIESLAEMVREQNGIRSGRARTTKPKKAKAAPSNDAEEDAVHELEHAMRLVGHGLPRALAARAVGSSTSTLHRREARRRAGAPLLKKRGPGMKPSAPAVLRSLAAMRVRAVHGLIGCDSLSHAVPGLSRRECAVVKRDTLTAMERDRKTAAARVGVRVVGAVRGFDAMYVITTAGRRYALASADAAIPFRTTITPCVEYDAVSVAGAAERDFRQYGPPLVWRVDRCAAHTAPPVLEVMNHFGVLVLHGPPHHPGYYGQLERQNREHRAWLHSLGALEADALRDELDLMRESLNGLIPRRSLQWCTPNELWSTRRVIDDHRAALREEVDERAERIRRTLDEREVRLGSHRRFAIEHALRSRGYLELTNTGRR